MRNMLIVMVGMRMIMMDEEIGVYRRHAGDRWSHWCPQGCGKKVRWNRKEWTFICAACGSKYKNKADMEKRWEAET